MCVQKQRFVDRDEKHVKYGMMIFQKWWNLTYKSKQSRTYDQFAKSPFYNAFIKFARHLLDINAVEPDQFVTFVLKLGLPIDDWCSDAVYELYLRELNKRESADKALERNFMLMERWAVSEGEDWRDFFKKVAPAQAVHWIKAGRISPWVIYTASTAVELLSRLSPEQHMIIESVLDPVFWEKKLAANADDVEAIRAVLEEAGV